MNPFLKTFLTNLIGAFASVAIGAFDHPTGGFASTLTTHPELGLVYIGAQQFAHNLFSKYFPPSTVVTQPQIVSVPQAQERADIGTHV